MTNRLLCGKIYTRRKEKEREPLLDLKVGSMDFEKIRISDVNGEFHEYDMKEELVINDHDLYNEFSQQPVKYMYWTSVLEQVRAYLESSILSEETVRADLYEPARMALIGSGTAKPTKDQIESWIIKQDQWVTAKNEVLVYTKYVKQLQYVVKAYEQRKDMLIQIGADSRKDKEYEKHINFPHAK